MLGVKVVSSSILLDIRCICVIAWNLGKLKWPSAVTLSTRWNCLNTTLVLSILYKACSRYWSVSSLCVLYCARRIKSTITWVSALLLAPWSKVIMTGINCLIIALCSTPVHCLILLKQAKCLSPVNGGTHRKRSSSWTNPEDSLIVLPCRFLLQTAGKTLLASVFTHIIRYIVMLLRSWWRTSIIIALWIFRYRYFQAKFSTSWTQVSSSL
jgi:hypothetical protein